MSRPLKILLVFGTRPEAIKLAPVLAALQSRPDQFDPVVAVTAQHREMLDQVLQLFGIVPKYDLDIMKQGQTPSDITVKAMRQLEPVLESEAPDVVLVQGDTTTVFAASLAAFYRRIAVAHVEAGLRTQDRYQPFPEEINRRLVTCLADLHFAPTEWARENLLREGIARERVHVTGNSVVDALLAVLSRPVSESTKTVLAALGSAPFDVSTALVGARDDRRANPLILVTAHRRENWGAGISAVCDAIKELSIRHRHIRFVFSVHPNPTVQDAVRGALEGMERIQLVRPLDYEPFVHLMSNAFMVMSDSGGVQEEAPSLGVPVLVLRNVTERPEGVECGALQLVGTDTKRIVAAADRLLADPSHYEKMSRVRQLYGDGQASVRIADALAGWGASRKSASPPLSSDLVVHQ